MEYLTEFRKMAGLAPGSSWYARPRTEAEFAHFVTEGARLPVGTKRQWGDRELVKAHNGRWVPTKKHSGTKPAHVKKMLKHMGVHAGNIGFHAANPKFRAHADKLMGKGWEAHAPFKVPGSSAEKKAANYHKPNAALAAAKAGALDAPSHAEMMAAYGDAHSGEGEDAMKAPRKLRALGHQMTVDAWRDTMKTAAPEGYNDFDAARVHKVLSKFGDKIKVTPGRESSPVVYVHGDKETLAQIQAQAKRMKTDEADIHDDGYLWKNFYTDHTGQEQMVPEAGPDKKVVEMKGPVLRLWWD
jgi:hypothetical protein